jgi:acyl-CoA synthetase (AMP-forming)/AMP-acid ligase II
MSGKEIKPIDQQAQPIYRGDHLCADAIAHHARENPQAIAVVCDNERLDWHDLNSAVNRQANALITMGCGKGDKVCMLMPNGLPAFVLFWGAVRAGCVIVPLNPMLDDTSLARLATASDGKVIFADDYTAPQIDRIRGQLPNISPAGYLHCGSPTSGWNSATDLLSSSADTPPGTVVEPDDSMTIFYSSGTTGTPKGIEHSHFGRLNYCYGFGAGLGINRGSVAICSTPIYASGTMITMLPALYYGGKVVLLPRFTPETFFSAVAQEGGTHGFMVPAMYVSLLQHGGDQEDLSTLRVLVSAGQSMPLTTRDALGELAPKAGIHEVYGMTEGFFTIALPSDFASGKRNTVGKAGFLEDIRVIDDEGNELPHGTTGEIVAYGPGMMKGYYGRADLTAETVWSTPEGKTFLRSGDLGHLDKDGFLYVSGRKKDMIKSGGINIYAVDIEGVLASHPAVGEVAVVGVPHTKWSETPIGAVALVPGAQVTAQELLYWANERLAKYQRLDRVVLVSDFPRATYGKIRKDRLRDELIASSE